MGWLGNVIAKGMAIDNIWRIIAIEEKSQKERTHHENSQLFCKTIAISSGRNMIQYLVEGAV